MPLTNHAMLVSLTIKQWGARKLDRNASNELCDSKQAQRSSGNFNKLLIPKIHLQAIQKLVNSIRNYHYSNTLPWEHKGSDILPSNQYFEYTQQMGNFKTQFENKVDEFLTAYPTILEQVESSLKDLYNEHDYPSVEVISKKFELTVSMSPIPDAGDFRIDLEQAEIDKLEEQLSERMVQANKNAETELFSRLYTTVAKAVVKLKDPVGVFRNTLIINIIEEATKAPNMNVNNNPDIDALSLALLKVTKLIDIEELRKDLPYRQEQCDELEKILNDIDTAFTGATQ